MNDDTFALPTQDTSAAEAAPRAAAGSATDAAAQRAAEWERMVRIRGARHAGPSALRTRDERPR
jgi:hypothetical protein